MGSVIGAVFGEFLGWMMPEGVVKQFLLTGIELDLGGIAGYKDVALTLNHPFGQTKTTH